MRQRPRPVDEDNYEKFIKLESDSAIIFCVECDAWHQIELQAMAKMRLVIWFDAPHITEVNPDTITLACNGCGVSIEYLVRDFRTRVIRHILGDMPGGEVASVVVQPKPRLVQKEFNYAR